MNVRLGDKWYADNVPIETYFKAIQLLGLEKIEARGLTFKDRNIKNAKECPIVTMDRVKGFEQVEVGEYYVLRLWDTQSMKKTLESIASELEDDIDIEVTTYRG